MTPGQMLDSQCWLLIVKLMPTARLWGEPWHRPWKYGLGLAWPLPAKIDIFLAPHWSRRSSPASDWRTLRSALCHLVYSWYPGPVNKKTENIQINLFPAKKKCLPNLDMWGTIITKRVKYVNTDKCFTSHIRLRFTYFSANLLISQDS